MEAIVYLILVVIGLIILAKQGWLKLMGRGADVLQGKADRKILEIEEEDEYVHHRNLGKTAAKWANNDKPLANKDMVAEARKAALAAMYGETK